MERAHGHARTRTHSRHLCSRPPERTPRAYPRGEATARKSRAPVAARDLASTPAHSHSLGRSPRGQTWKPATQKAQGPEAFQAARCPKAAACLPAGGKVTARVFLLGWNCFNGLRATKNRWVSGQRHREALATLTHMHARAHTPGSGGLAGTGRRDAGS